MKKIGLVGGIGPASTVEYYLGLIKGFHKIYSNEEYPEIVIDSVDMNAATKYCVNLQWDKSADLMLKSIINLSNAGADIAAITANTEHIVWDLMKEKFPIPVISIIDAVVNKVKVCGYHNVLILGTSFTMKSGMYENAFLHAGIGAVVPDESDISAIGDIIYPNLENGIIVLKDKKELMRIVKKYTDICALDAVLLGCTELPIMIKEGDFPLPIINSTQIHIEAILDAIA